MFLVIEKNSKKSHTITKKPTSDSQKCNARLMALLAANYFVPLDMELETIVTEKDHGDAKLQMLCYNRIVSTEEKRFKNIRRKEKSIKAKEESSKPRTYKLCDRCGKSMSMTKCNMPCLVQYYANAGMRSDQKYSTALERGGCKYGINCHYLHAPEFVGMRVLVHYIDQEDWGDKQVEGIIVEDRFSHSKEFIVDFGTTSSQLYCINACSSFLPVEGSESRFIVPGRHIVRFLDF